MRFPSVLCSLPALVVLAALPALCQTAKPDPRYAGESAVFEHVESVTAMQADGTGYRERWLVVRVQSEATLRELSVVTIPFASASEKVEIQYARVRHPDGTVTETPVTDALEQPTEVTREAPFYSDLKTKQLPIRSLHVGDTLDWKARIVRTKAEAANQFWGDYNFTENFVVLSEVAELRFPKAVKANVWTGPKAGVKPVESDTATEHVYRWEHAQLTPTVGKEADAEKEKKKTKLLTEDEETDAEQGALPALAWTTFPSWQAVGDWYRSLETGRNLPDAEVKQKVAELTAGKTTDEAKARAVYGYVSGQIRYIGVAFGVGRYQPHASGDVLANQYGDCKDKHTLLAAMLTQIGLKPNAVLIGAGIRFNEAVPSPAAFNHLITQVEVDGKPVWLDATAEVAPYKMLMFQIRDKQALVIPDAGEPRIERTPKDPPFPSAQSMKAVGSLTKDGISDSRLTLTFRGDIEIYLRQVLRQVPPAQYTALVERFTAGMGYAGKAEHPEILHVEDSTEPLVMSFDYHREKGGDWDHFRIVPQLAPVELAVPDEKTPPVASIDLGVPRTEFSQAEMKLPAGWGAELPEAIHEKSEWVTYDETYKLDAGTIYTERRIVVLKSKVPAAQWKVYKKWTDAVSLGSDMFIQLTRTGAAVATSGKGSTGPPAPTASNAEAAKLIQQAIEALDAQDIAKASPLLDKARDLNNTQRTLWGAMGYMSLKRGEMTEALRDYQKELALHPESTWVYPNIVRVQLLQGQRADAIETLKKWNEAEPKVANAVQQLTELQIEDGNAAGAVDTATAAIARLPEDMRDDETFKFSLGKAQLKAGMEAKGGATMLAVLQKAENPLMLNNAAYELADANQQLPAAETATRKALDQLATESQSWTADESPNTLRLKSSLIVSAWDTLGWIYFRQGKLDQAESYVQAAWLMNHHTEVGEHLGDIQAAQGRQTEAYRSYRLAAATISAIDMMGRKKKDTSPAGKRLSEKADKAKKAGAKTDLNGDPGKLVQAERTHSLGPANGRDGSAEYIFLLNGGKAEKIHPATAKTITGAEDLIGKATFTRLTPMGSTARPAVASVINCHAGTCELIFE